MTPVFAFLFIWHSIGYLSLYKFVDYFHSMLKLIVSLPKVKPSICWTSLDANKILVKGLILCRLFKALSYFSLNYKKIKNISPI